MLFISYLKKVLSNHRFFVWGYGAIYLSFLWPLVLLQKTFIRADYWAQYYPWAFTYAKYIRSGEFPYWLPGLSGGFPLVAEGQVGAYYLLHLLFYRLLDFSVAYTLLILLHFLLGGIGAYLYGRQLNLSKEASTLVAILYSFSSSYGGCFSNVATLKVLTWLPWSLILWESIQRNSGFRKWLWLSCLAGVFAQMWTAGAQQIALYAMGYLALFWLIKDRGRGLVNFLVAHFIGFILSAPQWIASVELLKVSVRSNESIAFALIDSSLPLSFLALFYPKWGGFLITTFYIGAIGFFLVGASILFKMNRMQKIFLSLAVLFFLISLGKYNPVYVYFIKIFELKMFRGPFKFIFFSTFSLTILAGFGYDALIQFKQKHLKNRLRYFVMGSTLLIALLPLLGKITFLILKKDILDFAYKSAKFVYSSKTDPIHGLDYYYQKADKLFLQVEQLFTYKDPSIQMTILFFTLSAFVIFLMTSSRLRVAWKKVLLLGVLIADLFFYGNSFSVGFIGNVGAHPRRLPDSLVKTIQSRQVDASSLVEWLAPNQPSLLPANASLIYSLNSAGGYSPLLIKRYYDISKDFGISDSSLGQNPFSEEKWNREFGLVTVLGVGQVLSRQPLSLESMRLIELDQDANLEEKVHSDNKYYLYATDHVLPLTYIAYDWKKIPTQNQDLSYFKNYPFDPFKVTVVEAESLNIHPTPGIGIASLTPTKHTDTEFQVELETTQDALVVFRSMYYPRWKAMVDGEDVQVLAVNHVASGVSLEKGKHVVRYYYDIGWIRAAEWGMGIAWAFLILLFISYTGAANEQNNK